MTTEPTAISPAQRNPTSPQIFQRIVLGVCAAVLAVALGVMAYASTLRVSHNYNEGWNAYLAQAALSGGPLYFPDAAWFTNNYPPLSFYLVGGVGRLFGDAILAGRAVAWVGLRRLAFPCGCSPPTISLNSARTSVAAGRG